MENDYISREEAKRELLAEATIINDRRYMKTDSAIAVLDTIPAADVAPVVRCKDCVYFIQGKIHGHCDIHCNGVGEEEVVKKDFFCAYGKRTL